MVADVGVPKALRAPGSGVSKKCPETEKNMFELFSLVDVLDIFYFFCSGRLKGESEAPGGGGIGFLLKVPGGGGSPELGEGRLGLPGQVWELRFLPSSPSFFQETSQFKKCLGIRLEAPFVKTFILAAEPLDSRRVSY